MKLLDKVANIALILGVGVFLFVVARGELTRRATPESTTQKLLGTSVNLPGHNFNQKRASLLMVISTTCHFCKDSLPFYKDLAERASKKIDIIAVMPQPLEEAKGFLQTAEVPIHQIITAETSAVGVHGTPTLLLVDGDGKISNVWEGRLDDKGKQDVLKRVLQ